MKASVKSCMQTAAIKLIHAIFSFYLKLLRLSDEGYFADEDL